MAAIINTNIASLNLQKSLSTSQAQLNKAMERLSSGLRVNKAQDDAAGLAIATTLDSNIRGMQVAVRNLNDAVSFSQVQESALSTQTELFQRMRELAVQSANGSLGTTDRGNLNTEFQTLLAELGRVSDSSFNGNSLFGSSSITYQIGAGTSDTVTSSAISKMVSFATNGTTLPATAVGFKAVTTAGTPNTTEFYAVNAAGNYINATGDTDNGSTTTGSHTVKVTFSGGTSGGLATADINSVANATTMLTEITSAIGQINTNRSSLGALQSRLSSIGDSLASSIENSTAAKSRIMDADYAQETSNLTRGQILQQAGTAMLTQANSMPNIVLSLLKG